jgi:CRP/FNR family cyclic AMP-dependent transcriptional regulator
MSSSPGLGSLLPREAWQALLASGAVRRFAKGETLMRQGEPGSYVFILAAGRVKVARVDADGNELLLAVLGVADIVGELAVLGGGMRSATVTALVPCITYVLSAAAFLRIVRERRAEQVLVRYLIARQRESDDARAELAGLKAIQRGWPRLAAVRVSCGRRAA